MVKTKSNHPAAGVIENLLIAYPELDLSHFIDSDIKPDRKLLSTKETCGYLGGISRMGIWRLVNIHKSIRPVWIGSRQMFDVDDLNKHIRKNKRFRRTIREYRKENKI